MIVINPSVSIESDIDGKRIIKQLEKIGRVCYKSEDKISENSGTIFIKNILTRGHESVIEHVSVSVRVICDRGVSHEIVRHRLASYSQESTRYCNYTQDKFDNQITFIRPLFWDEESSQYKTWLSALEIIERSYFNLIELGAKPEEARSVLPNSLKTELIMTMNLREWRHFFKLRTSSAAHPQMREVASMIFNEFRKAIPVIFDDIQLTTQ